MVKSLVIFAELSFETMVVFPEYASRNLVPAGKIPAKLTIFSPFGKSKPITTLSVKLSFVKLLVNQY